MPAYLSEGLTLWSGPLANIRHDPPSILTENGVVVFPRRAGLICFLWPICSLWLIWFVCPNLAWTNDMKSRGVVKRGPEATPGMEGFRRKRAGSLALYLLLGSVKLAGWLARGEYGFTMFQELSDQHSRKHITGRGTNKHGHLSVRRIVFPYPLKHVDGGHTPTPSSLLSFPLHSH